MVRPASPLLRRRARPGPSLPTARTLWWRVRTHPWAYWTLAVLLALGTAWFVHRSASAVAAPGSGPVRSVPFATTTLDRGDDVASSDVAWREVPAGLLPDGIAGDPVGHRVVEPIVAGEPILARRLAPDALSATAALLPPGHRAVAVPRDVATPPIEVGDRVDVLAAFPFPGGTRSDDADAGGTDDAGGPTPTGALAADALVVAVEDEAITVALERAEAVATVEALGQGVVALALSGR